MNDLIDYIRERSTLGHCNAERWDCDRYINCNECLESKIAEHDAKVIADVSYHCEKCEADQWDALYRAEMKGRKKAIDEFADLIESAFLNAKFDITDVRPMAEQLKEQK